MVEAGGTITASPINSLLGQLAGIALPNLSLNCKALTTLSISSISLPTFSG